MTTIIGIVGGKGAGKSTAADYLVENYGATAYAFADDVKEYVIRVYDLRREQVYGIQEQKETVDPRYGITPRVMMQRAGDGAREVFGDSFWIDRLFAKIAKDRPKLAVISDVRRINEAVQTRRDGFPGLAWRLHYAPGLRRSEDPHASEQEWLQAAVDLEITPGPGGVAELYALLDDACGMFGIPALVASGRAFADLDAADPSKASGPALQALAELAGVGHTIVYCRDCYGTGDRYDVISRYGAPGSGFCRTCHGTGRQDAA